MLKTQDKQTNFEGFIIWSRNHLFLAVTPLFICLIATVAYMSLTTKQYQQSTAITLKLATNGSAMTRDIMLFNEISFVKRQTSFDNEKEFFRSISMAEELVKMVNMQYEVYADLGITNKLLYNDSPISYTLETDESCQTFTADAFISEKGVILKDIKFNGENFKKELAASYGQPIKTCCGFLTINETGKKANFDKLILKYRDPNIAAAEVSKHLKFHTATRFATVLNFNYTDNSPERAKDIVTNLPKAYNNLWNKHITSSAQKQSAEIEQKLKNITHEIDSIGTIIKTHKPLSKRKFLNTEFYSAISILNKIQSTGDSLIILPTNTLKENSLINNQINEYNALIKQIKRLLSKGRINWEAVPIANNATSLKDSIETNLNGYIKKITPKQDNLNNIENSKATSAELQYIANIRHLNVLKNTYYNLKKKQEECSLTTNIDLNAVRLIRKPLAEAKIVSPNLPSAIFLTFLFGIIITPYLLYLINDTIQNKRNSLK